MSTLERIRAALAPDIESLEQRIARQLETDNPLLQAIIANSLKSKGKLIRPIIVILVARMLGGINDKVIDAASAVELLHNASLVHDDVVDASPSRRGKPTINAVWDNHVAVLVGDYFVSSALQLAINTADLRIVETVCNLGKSLSLGELDQIYNAYHHSLTEEAYYRIIGCKTASLFCACARMGAYAQDSDDEAAHSLAEFAELLGLAFQVRDDVFDYFSDPAVGKPTGNDLLEGKVTLPLLHVLLDETIPGQPEMLALSRKEQLSTDEVHTLTQFAVDNGGIEYAFQCMEQMRQKASHKLDRFPDSKYKTMLLELFDYIISRNY